MLDSRIDDLLESAGGFGRLHFLIVSSWVLTDNGTFAVIAALSYLTKVPEEYLCTYAGSGSETFSCTPDDFCSSQDMINFQPDAGSDNLYENWV